MRRMLATHRPDVVHVHNVFPLLSPWVVRAAHDAGVPVVQTVHNFRQTAWPVRTSATARICTDCVGRRIATPALSTAATEVPGCRRSPWSPDERCTGRRGAPSTGSWSSPLPRPAPRSARRARLTGSSYARRPAPDPGALRQPGHDVLFAGRLDARRASDCSWTLGTCVARTTGAWSWPADGPLAQQVRDHAARDASIVFRGRLTADEVAAENGRRSRRRAPVRLARGLAAGGGRGDGSRPGAPRGRPRRGCRR